MMPFFRIDDSYWSHPKILALTPAARDLWTRAGSYSMQHLTDGLISKSALTILGARPKQIRELVESGLWIEVLVGFQFHDWDDYQETADRLKDKRDKARERMRALRANPPTGSDDVRANESRTDDECAREVDDVARGPSHPIPSLPMVDSGLDPSVPESARENATDKEIPPELIKWASGKQVDFQRVHDRFVAQAEEPVPFEATQRLIGIVIGRARQKDGDRTGVVIASLRRDWQEWSRLVFQDAS